MRNTRVYHLEKLVGRALPVVVDCGRHVYYLEHGELLPILAELRHLYLDVLSILLRTNEEHLTSKLLLLHCQQLIETLACLLWLERSPDSQLGLVLME